MTHDELLAKIDEIEIKTNNTALLLGVQTALLTQNKALRAVVELHKNYDGFCAVCMWEDKYDQLNVGWYEYPCPTIQAIEKELK